MAGVAGRPRTATSLPLREIAGVRPGESGGARRTCAARRWRARRSPRRAPAIDLRRELPGAPEIGLLRERRRRARRPAPARCGAPAAARAFALVTSASVNPSFSARASSSAMPARTLLAVLRCEDRVQVHRRVLLEARHRAARTATDSSGPRARARGRGSAIRATPRGSGRRPSAPAGRRCGR